MISHDREVLAGAVRSIVTLEGNGAWIHGGSYATYPQAARTASDASATRSGAGTMRRSACVELVQDLQGARQVLERWRQGATPRRPAGGGSGSRPATGAGRRHIDRRQDAWRRLGRGSC